MVLYLAALAPDGLLLAHVSNRHLDLGPVFRGHADALKLYIGVSLYRPDASDAAEGAMPNRVIALSRTPLHLKGLGIDWAPLLADPLDWTDDAAAIWSVLRW